MNAWLGSEEIGLAARRVHFTVAAAAAIHVITINDQLLSS